MILAVTGGKGGVGKTTVAYNVGTELDAVVVDADVGMADLPRGRGPDLHDVLADRADPLEAIRGDPVRLLPCGRSLAGARAADVTRLDGVLRRVERRHGDVIVDCPAGLHADAGVPLAVADACLVVASPQPFALADAIRVRELARELDAGFVAVAVNRAVDDAPVATIERALGAPTTVVPADPRVARSVSEKRPLSIVAPESEAGCGFSTLAAAVQACKSV